METKLIPGSLGFMASNDGQILDPLNNVRPTYKNLDGYSTSSIKMLNHKWVTYGIHRLVASAFLGFDLNNKTIKVNHIDSNINNNHISNLEITTNKENVIHGVIKRGTKKISIIVKYPNGKSKGYCSIADVSKDLNLEEKYVWYLIKNHKDINGITIEYYKIGSKLPDDLKKSKGGIYQNRILKIYNIDSFEVLCFPSIHEAARYFNTKANHIHITISDDNNIRVFRNKYIILDIDKDFPNLSKNDYVKLSEPKSKKVVAFNIVDKKVSYYISAADFIRKNKLSKKAISTRLRDNIIKESGNWVFLYDTPSNQQALSEYISVQLNDSTPYFSQKT